MHPTIANIAAEFSRRVPDELMGTRAAIFYLMARPARRAPQSVCTQIGAAFGRVMETSVNSVKRPATPSHTGQLQNTATQDAFVFAGGPYVHPTHA